MWPLGRVSLMVSTCLVSLLASTAAAEEAWVNGGLLGNWNGVPNYDMDDFAGNNDCGPTAAAMLLGYYDTHGWPSMIPDATAYYPDTAPPPAGLVDLHDRLKAETPYSEEYGMGGPALLGAIAYVGEDIVKVAAQMDPGAAAWGSDDDQFTNGGEDIKTNIRAKRPVLLCVKDTCGYMRWYDPGTSSDNATVDVNWHWMPVIGFNQQGDDLWLALRSGWRTGGNSCLWYTWTFWDDVYTVEIFPAGAPQVSVGPHVLWTHSGGTAALSTITYAGGVPRTKYFPAQAGLTARCYDRTNSTTARLLWSGPDGKAEVWKLDRFDNYVSKLSYQGWSNWDAVYYQKLSDGTSRLLWNVRKLVPTPGLTGGDAGWAILWTLDANDQVVRTRAFKMASHRALSYQKRGDRGWLLWMNSHGNPLLWKLDGAEATFLDLYLLPMQTGYRAACLQRLTNSDYTNGYFFLFGWNPGSGHTRMQRLTSELAPEFQKWFGPYAGWTMRSFSEN